MFGISTSDHEWWFFASKLRALFSSWNGWKTLIAAEKSCIHVTSSCLFNGHTSGANQRNKSRWDDEMKPPFGLVNIFRLLLSSFVLCQGLVHVRTRTSNSTTTYNAPLYSKYIGNLSSWNCSQSGKQLVNIGKVEYWCDEEFQGLNQTYIRNLVAGKVTVLLEVDGLRYPCNQEEIYRNVESLGAVALFNVRDKLEVRFYPRALNLD